jgi:hypothetical protein
MARKQPTKPNRLASAAQQRRRSKKEGSSRREATVLIPLTYKDGSRIAPGVVDAIFEELFRHFGGWTIEGRVKGAYRMQSGQKQVENLLKVSVILEAGQLPILESLVSRWCRELGQETMLLKVADFTIKFVPPLPEAENR